MLCGREEIIMVVTWIFKRFSRRNPKPPFLLQNTLKLTQQSSISTNICRGEYPRTPGPLTWDLTLCKSGRLNTDLILHRAMCYQQRWLWHPEKQTQQRWICSNRPMWFTPFDSMVTKFITFSPRNHPLHIRSLPVTSFDGWKFSWSAP